MAQYKYFSYLDSSTSSDFDTTHSPGTKAPRGGIYRCTSCGDEIAISGGHTLPPQNHRQHTSNSSIEWKLIVASVQT